MREYLIEFEKLANHTEGFPDAFYLIYFINGLKDAIRYEVKIFFPNTMMEAPGLAKLAEDKIRAQQCSKSTLVPPAPRTTPINHLFEAKMQER